VLRHFISLQSDSNAATPNPSSDRTLPGSRTETGGDP